MLINNVVDLKYQIFKDVTRTSFFHDKTSNLKHLSTYAGRIKITENTEYCSQVCNVRAVSRKSIAISKALVQSTRGRERRSKNVEKSKRRTLQR